MKTIKERAYNASKEYRKDVVRFKIPTFEQGFEDGYMKCATGQRAIDIEKACKCFCDVCGCKECAKRNVVCTEYKEFRKAMEESEMSDEEYLNSKIEAYGKAHPNGNKEDLELLAEMRGYDKEDEL